MAEPIAPNVVATLVTATGGNPLALVEIPPTLREGQRLGAEPLDDPLRGGAAVERAFGARLSVLSAEAQRVLLIAAVSDSLQLGPIVTAAGAAADGLDEAEAAGLIGVTDERIHFRHPLVRSAIDTAATSGEKRSAHAALAAALDGVDDDRATWHRAAATVGPDEAVAAELERVAEGARRRGGAESQARLLDRAARLTPDPERRAARLYAAGGSAYDAGRVDYGAALLDDGLALNRDPLLHADLVERRAEVAWARGEIAAWVTTCSEEADRVAEHDPARAARLLFHVYHYFAEQNRVARCREVLDRILALTAGAPEDRLSVLNRAWQGMMEDEIAEARSAAIRVIELSASRVNVRAVEALYVLANIGDVEAAAAAVVPMIARFRQEGALFVLDQGVVRSVGRRAASWAVQRRPGRRERRSGAE